MSNGIGLRLLGFWIGIDEAFNALFGGSWWETISGTVGRAAEAGKWWAKWIAAPLVNAIMFNPNHCQQAAAREEARREKLGTSTSS